MPSKVTICQGLIDRWQRMFGLHGATAAWQGRRRANREMRWCSLYWQGNEKRYFFSFSKDLFALDSPTVLCHTLVFLLWVKNQSPNGHHITRITKGYSPFCFLQSQVYAKLHQKKAKWEFSRFTVSRLRSVSVIIMKFHAKSYVESLRVKTSPVSTHPSRELTPVKSGVSYCH